MLPKDNFGKIPFAYHLYKSQDPKFYELAGRFKNGFAREVTIKFLGVWFVSSRRGEVCGLV